MRLLLLAQEVEELHLPAQVALMALGHGIQHAGVDRQKLRAVQPEAVHRAAFDEVLDGALVEVGLAHALGQILQRLERAVFLALGDHLPQQAAPDVLHRAKPEADALRLDREFIL